MYFNNTIISNYFMAWIANGYAGYASNAFLEANKDSLICIDEVQRYPQIFQIFRGYLDRNKRTGQLLFLNQ